MYTMVYQTCTGKLRRGRPHHKHSPQHVQPTSAARDPTKPTAGRWANAAPASRAKADRPRKHIAFQLLGRCYYGYRHGILLEKNISNILKLYTNNCLFSWFEFP